MSYNVNGRSEIIEVGLELKCLPGRWTEGHSSNGVVVSQEASIGQQAERPVWLSHPQQCRLRGQIPQTYYTWK